MSEKVVRSYAIDIRRLGLQIAAQLPENPADALAVLEFATLVVEKMLMDGESATAVASAPVIRLVKKPAVGES